MMDSAAILTGLNALQQQACDATATGVRQALTCDNPGERELAALLSATAAQHLEAMAQRARALTQRHFGHTVQLYVPLYLSSYCAGGCVYCGFASDREAPRHVLSSQEAASEMEAIKRLGFEEILLLTGERTEQADHDYLCEAVRAAAARFHRVTAEVFPMSREEYGALREAGCTGVTLYQETYDPARYETLHRWGPKADYEQRLQAPGRLLAAGIRSVGLGALLGLSDPVYDMLALYRHARTLRRDYWKAGISISFPRVRPQAGGYQPEHPVEERRLAQFIYAFRCVMPDVPLVLSTRENPAFRDGMAGVGVSKMSAASRTTVGGYSDDQHYTEGQFAVSDDRDVEAVCAALRARGLEAVFKNWDGTYR